MDLNNKIVDYLQITDSAVKEITNKISAKKKVFGIKVGIKTKGCSGMAYTIEYATQENITKYDELAKHQTVKVYIDPKISLFLFNSTLDFVEKKSKSGATIESGFVFTNPNETGRCGCGESFYV